MTKLEKLYSIIENSREVEVKLSKDVLQQVEELEEGIIKEEILPALGNDIAPRLEPIKRDLVLVVEYHPGEPISVALSRKTKISGKLGTVLVIHLGIRNRSSCLSALWLDGCLSGIVLYCF